MIRFVDQKDAMKSKFLPSVPHYSELDFINIVRPEQIKDGLKQRKIRRHVMKRIGMSRRREHQNSTTVPLQFKPRANASIPSVKVLRLPLCAYWDKVMLAMNLVGDSALELAIGTAAADFVAQLGDMSLGSTVAESGLTRYNKFLGIVRSDLSHLGNEFRTHEAIATIIGLAIYDMRIRNIARWMIHMDGLARIIRSLGGLETLTSYNVLRRALFWSEVTGSLTLDLPSRFSSMRPFLKPVTVVPVENIDLHNRFRYSCQTRYPVVADVVQVMTAVSDLATKTTQALHLPAVPVPHNAMDWVQSVICLAHDLLALPRLKDFGDSLFTLADQLAMREAVRLAGLAFVATTIAQCVEDKFYRDVLGPGNYRGRMKQHLIASQLLDWFHLKELKLWVLVVGAVIEAGSEQAWFIKQIRQTMRFCGLCTWDEAFHTIQRVAWIDILASEEITTIARAIEGQAEEDSFSMV